ncbi:hypothetical protein RND71_027468 [Anisodus tanguticus]|uniref:Uncharacterized protein n=1 Tax=Anisodus tanguticus TaxID=243964 RepID=A0AAE1RGP4_9SOLA|nr:hypothetical protein RND71_027468 [Anisodus tanguticus]
MSLRVAPGTEPVFKIRVRSYFKEVKYKFPTTQRSKLIHKCSILPSSTNVGDWLFGQNNPSVHRYIVQVPYATFQASRPVYPRRRSAHPNHQISRLA